MAADVDKTPAGEPKDDHVDEDRATPSSRRARSRFKQLSSLFLIAAVPFFGFCIKYYQDIQLVKRHVS